MPRCLALFRAINVGGRTVKMDRLRALLAELPLADVETYIASGNALFTTRAADTAALESRIERHLERALGFAVETFVRTPDEMAAVAARAPFDDLADGHTLHVLFTRAPLDDAARARVAALDGDYDSFAVHGREVWWRTRGRSSDSKLTPAKLERALGMPATARNVTTVRALAERLAGR